MSTESTAAGDESAAKSSLETPDAENPEEPEDPSVELKDGAPTADWLPESSPPTTSGPVP